MRNLAVSERVFFLHDSRLPFLLAAYLLDMEV